ncbi:MAG: carbohydrate binding domain-containing protein [Phycicoccus sp.]
MRTTAPSDSAATTAGARAASGTSLTANSGFEKGSSDWTIYEASSIKAQAVVAPVTGTAYAGKGSMRLLLPKQAQNNQRDYISIGQSLKLDPRKRYEVSVKVRWLNPGNTLPSAIISAWSRNADGSYGGEDRWITEKEAATAPDGWVTIAYNFTPTSRDPAFVYLSLLTHQNGNSDATDVLIDDFTVVETSAAPYDPDGRTGNLLGNGDFEAGSGTSISAPWTKTEWNPTRAGGLSSTVVGAGDRQVRLTLPGSSNPNLLNNTWTGVRQPVRLNAGVTYEYCADIDRVKPSDHRATILNMYAFKDVTSTPRSWVGSIDYKFADPEPHRHCQRFVAPETATYEMTLRDFGWGQAGLANEVLIDNVSLEVVPRG